MGNKEYDVIVIGAGIVGVSTAIHLQQKGKNVLLLDKKGVAQETSFGNAGIIESSYVLPFTLPQWTTIPDLALGKIVAARISYPSGLKYLPWIIDLYLKSQPQSREKNGRLLRPLLENAVEEHKSLMEKTDGLQHIASSGRIKLHRSESSFLAGRFERKVAQELGVPFDIIEVADFNEIEPAIHPVFYKAVSWTGSARYTNPSRAISCVADKFTQNGGHLKIEEVTALNSVESDSWSVQTNQDCYSSREVVLCTGPWGNKLLKPLGHQVPIGIKRGYHQHFECFQKVSHAIVDADEGYVIAPMEDGIRLITGAELADINAPDNAIQIEQSLPKARELLSFGSEKDPKAWVGSRPCTADSLPIIGLSHKYKGLWFNLGHGHSGITIGPATGRLVAEMMSGEKPFCNPAPYSPKRFKIFHD